MAEYYALIQGKGEGCDWSIECGKDFQKLRAEKKEEAEQECLEIYENHGGKDGDPGIESITILEAYNVFEVDLNAYNQQKEDEQEAAEEEEREKKEREQYERLKQKYGEQG